MPHRFAITTILLAAAACNASDGKPVATMTLSSPSFGDGASLPVEFTCAGRKAPPPLAWDKVPAGTKSFVLILDDPDAPGGTFRHWGIFDIPASARSITSGQKLGREVTNDFGSTGYGAPCPPPGHGVHHYRFRLLALDQPTLELADDATVSDLESAASRHRLGEAELTGTFQRA